MLINNIDILFFKATLLEYYIQPAEVITYRDWLRNAKDPVFIGQEQKYKEILTKYAVEGLNEQEVLLNISNLVDQAQKCSLEFNDDNIEFLYDATIESTRSEKFSDTAYTLEIVWKSGYAYKPHVTEFANRVSFKTINVQGNITAPAILEITPSADLIDFAITGLNEAFTIRNLKAGQKVIINGEDHTVTQNGSNKFTDFEGWDFPLLKPRSNSIAFSKNSADVNIKYKPRWI